MGGTGSLRFYTARRRIYGALVVFVVAGALLMAVTPSLRGRLTERVTALKAAFKGEVPALSVDVGENTEPFPAEYERLVPAPLPAQASPIDQVFTMTPQPRVAPQPAPGRPGAAAAPASGRRPSPAPVLIDETAGQAEADAAPPDGNEPRYTTGAIEQEAYALVLESHPAAAAMVQGSNPSLRFKSWDAAQRGGDVYWVRLKFQSEENRDVEYIWQVRLGEKQASPLNYNARTLP